MTPTTEFPKLLDLALAEVQVNTRELVQKLQLASYAQWGLDEQNARLVFSNPGANPLAIAMQVIGSYDPKQLVWRWAWSLGTLPTNALRAANATREWGQTQEIELLTTPSASADEADCWKLTAFAARLTGWPAMYRGQTESGFLYLAFAGPLT